MTSGLYFMLSYTFDPAVDDGQDALVAPVARVGAELLCPEGTSSTIGTESVAPW
jgi:hypothetical protein